jgi:membrane protease subunit HflC
MPAAGVSRSRAIAVAVAFVVGLVVASNTFFVVDQRRQALVLRLGDPVRTINAGSENNPGLKAKIPFLENVLQFDKRNQALEAEREEIIASDQERLMVGAFVRYQIDDPLQFYRTLRDERTAADRLSLLVNSSLRQVLGSATSDDIVSKQRDKLMRTARDDVAKRAAESRLGVRIIDLRIRRADLPPQNQAAVFQRMRTARQQEAAQIRAIGEQQKRELIANADKEVAITLATATGEAEKTRGEGDSKRAALFASSFGRDASFAAFYRSMQAYDTALGQGDTTLVLSPDSDFFRYFERGPGK